MTTIHRVALLAATTISLLTATPLWAQETDITDQTITVEDQTFRYLAAGDDGPAIVLLHGWPQSADEFRHIMPDLAEDYRVFAPDLSGIGGSTNPDQDWTKQALADDIHGFVGALGLENPLVAGHDIGGMVAYAYGRQYPNELAGVIVMDVPLPGFAPWDWVVSIPNSWHFDFHDQPIAEDLVAGREGAYIRYFIDHVAKHPEAISDADVAIYAEAYGTPERLRAGFELYRAFDQDQAHFEAMTGPFDVPLLLIGAETTMAPALETMREALEVGGTTNVETAEIEDSGHWIIEEQPGATVKLIEAFAEKVF